MIKKILRGWESNIIKADLSQNLICPLYVVNVYVLGIYVNFFAFLTTERIFNSRTNGLILTNPNTNHFKVNRFLIAQNEGNAFFKGDN